MDKWLRELILLSVGAMAAFALFALLRILADRPEQQFRWESYAAASLIGAVFGLAETRALSSQAEKVAALEAPRRRSGEHPIEQQENLARRGTKRRPQLGCCGV